MRTPDVTDPTKRAYAGWLRRLVSRVKTNLCMPTGNLGTVSKPEDETIKLLKSIDDRLANIEATSLTFDRCMNNHNHQHKMAVTTGHWNG
jgi:hypothetical protein